MKKKNKDLTLARECSIKIIYQHLITGEKNADIYHSFQDKRTYNKRFLEKLIEFSDQNASHITKTLSSHTDLDLLTITKIDHAILYLGTVELLYFKDTPKSVILNECVDLAKKFSSDDAYKFINSILDTVGSKLRR